VGDQARPRAPNFFDRQLDPEVVAGIAVIKGGHGPRHLGPLRVVSGMVVAAVVSQLLHRPSFSQANVFTGRNGLPGSLTIILDDAFRPDLDVIRVLAGIAPGAALAQ
jgi:hypothetical protein